VKAHQSTNLETLSVHAMARSGLRGYGRHFPLSHPAKKFVDIIGWTCGMSVRLKLNHRRPEDCDHEALHARPIDAARVKRRPRPVQDARPIADDIAGGT
jgi:hypothetical protein